MMERTERLKHLAPALLPWFAACGRALPWREDTDPYHVWVSEIMLQQTRIETVKPYYARFLRELPTVAALAEADTELLHKLWEGLGYYSRVRNLQTAAQQIMEKHGGVFPKSYEELRALKGIGDYTAGAIASICFDLPTPAVDGNVLRVLSRITADPRPITDEKTRAAVRRELAAVYPPHRCGAFTQAIMELGETVCLPNAVPDCAHCPCREFCASFPDSWGKYPVKAPKKERRKERLTVLLLSCGDRIALRKREEKGLLAGLWELPNVPGQLTEEEALCLAEQWGCAPQRVCVRPSRSHVFTHVEWQMACYAISCREMPGELTWADPAALSREISLPTAFRKLL